MSNIYEALTEISLDPFKQLVAREDAPRALQGLGLSHAQAQRAIRDDASLSNYASESFDSCKTCMDPGDDSDPWDEADPAS